ncbi:MAG: hypothetical protein ACFFD2_03615 [Promethearchaeota archaeon]
MNLVKKCWNFGITEKPSFPQIEIYISTLSINLDKLGQLILARR